MKERGRICFGNERASVRKSVSLFVEKKRGKKQLRKDERI